MRGRGIIFRSIWITIKKISAIKRLILLTAFIGLSMTQAFSQTIAQYKIDTTFRYRSIFSFQTPFKLSDTIRFNHLFSGSLKNKPLVFPEFSERNFYYEQIQTINFANAWSYDRIPFIRPGGYFPMKIARPDSAVRYSLLIKRY